MKKIILILLLTVNLKALTQDTLKIKQIDSLVSRINKSGFKTQHDTIVNDVPALGLSMSTVITVITNNGYLKKYVNNVSGTQKEQNGSLKQTFGSNAFYFDENKLIKVEEYLVEGKERKEAEWYYADDKPLYYTLQSERSADRATFLLSMAKGLLSKFKN